MIKYANIPAIESAEDKTYTVKGAKACLATYCILNTLPYIIIIILSSVLDDFAFQWWAVGVLSGMIGWCIGTMHRKTIKIVLHSDKTVTHINIYGRNIDAYTHVPLTNYEQISIDEEGKVEYVKTYEFYQELRKTYNLCPCCICRKDSYTVIEAEEFIKDHQMDAGQEKSAV